MRKFITAAFFTLLCVASPAEACYLGREVSLDLHDTDVDNALRIIAEVSGMNIVIHPAVSGKLTLRLVDVPWDHAFQLILRLKGLYSVTEGNILIVAPVERAAEILRRPGG